MLGGKVLTSFSWISFDFLCLFVSLVFFGFFGRSWFVLGGPSELLRFLGALVVFSSEDLVPFVLGNLGPLWSSIERGDSFIRGDLSWVGSEWMLPLLWVFFASLIESSSLSFLLGDFGLWFSCELEMLFVELLLSRLGFLEFGDSCFFAF